jgi:hypothetical protein
VGDLQGGIELAEQTLGYRVVPAQDETIEARVNGGI